MSSVVVSDKRGGRFQVVVHFSYGECDRLPYNALRKVNAKIEQVPNDGIRAIIDFNLRDRRDASHFVQVLELFGEEGSYVHGSGSDAITLAKTAPDEEKDEDGRTAATAESAQGTSVAAPSPTQRENVSVTETPSASAGEVRNEAEDLEVEEETPSPAETVATSEWERAGDLALAESLAANEDRARMLARVAKAAGKAYTVEMIRRRLIRLLYHRFKDEAYVAAFMVRRGWKDATKDEVASVMAGK